jgi:transcriptional regulator with XRE-family HTH domain
MQARLNVRMSRKPDPNTFAGRLVLARKKRGLTQEKLATAVGLAQPVISKLERGTISGTTAISRLIRVLKVPGEWLEDGEGPEPNWEGGPDFIVEGVTLLDVKRTAPHAELSPEEQDLLVAFRMLPDDEQKELLHHTMDRAEHYNKFFEREMRKRGIEISGFVSPERAAEALPPAPTPPAPGPKGAQTYELPRPSETGNIRPSGAKNKKEAQ